MVLECRYSSPWAMSSRQSRSQMGRCCASAAASWPRASRSARLARSQYSHTSQVSYMLQRVGGGGPGGGVSGEGSGEQALWPGG